jgi:hypothetical protein
LRKIQYPPWFFGCSLNRFEYDQPLSRERGCKGFLKAVIPAATLRIHPGRMS